MKQLYVFGNEHLKEDSLARNVGALLKDEGYAIVDCRSPDELLDAEEEIVILDVVKDAKEPLVITDVSRLKTRNLISLHDFDVGYFLNLLKGLGEEKQIKIIGIPQEGDANVIAEKVKTWL